MYISLNKDALGDSCILLLRIIHMNHNNIINKDVPEGSCTLVLTSD